MWIFCDWREGHRNSSRRNYHWVNEYNLLTPNDPYMGRTAPLTSKRCILYIYSTNIGTEYFKHALYSPFFFTSKCSLFHNANLFGSCIHILYTGCAKIKKKMYEYFINFIVGNSDYRRVFLFKLHSHKCRIVVVAPVLCKHCDHGYLSITQDCRRKQLWKLRDVLGRTLTL